MFIITLIFIFNNVCLYVGVSVCVCRFQMLRLLFSKISPIVFQRFQRLTLVCLRFIKVWVCLCVCAGGFSLPPIASGLVNSLPSLQADRSWTRTHDQKAPPKIQLDKCVSRSFIQRFRSDSVQKGFFFHFFAFWELGRKSLQMFCVLNCLVQKANSKAHYLRPFLLFRFGLLEDYKSWIKLVSFN